MNNLREYPKNEHGMSVFPTITMEGNYITRGGNAVRILAIDTGIHGANVAALVDDTLCLYSAYGKYMNDGLPSFIKFDQLNLVEIVEGTDSPQ